MHGVPTKLRVIKDPLIAKKSMTAMVPGVVSPWLNR